MTSSYGDVDDDDNNSFHIKNNHLTDFKINFFQG